jgi:hypothetical protein
MQETVERQKSRKPSPITYDIWEASNLPDFVRSASILHDGNQYNLSVTTKWTEGRARSECFLELRQAKRFFRKEYGHPGLRTKWSFARITLKSQ